jgi:Tol biopolymer transport system component
MRPKGLRITAGAVLVSTSLAGLQASGPPDAEAAFPGANGLIVFESTRSEKLGEHLNLIRLDKAGRIRDLVDLGHGYSAVPSPDGEKLAFLRHEGRRCFVLYVMSTHGTGLREIDEGCDLEGIHVGLEMEWSPDGRKLAFTRTGHALSIADLNDGSIRTIPEAFAPSWSPDGRALVFGRESARRGALFRLPLDANSEPVRLRLQGVSPKWSPDGTRIAFLEYRDRGN